jgi:hypothetical protein
MTSGLVLFRQVARSRYVRGMPRPAAYASAGLSDRCSSPRVTPSVPASVPTGPPELPGP